MILNSILLLFPPTTFFFFFLSDFFYFEWINLTKTEKGFLSTYYLAPENNSYLLQAQARVRMVKQKGSDKSPTFWNNVWGQTKENEKTGKMKITITFTIAFFICLLLQKAHLFASVAIFFSLLSLMSYMQEKKE